MQIEDLTILNCSDVEDGDDTIENVKAKIQVPISTDDFNEQYLILCSDWEEECKFSTKMDVAKRLEKFIKRLV